jgi:hypothetical protein
MKKMKAIFILTVTLLFSSIAFASDENKTKEPKSSSNTLILTGKVTDNQTGEALTGVKIELPGTNLAAYTDFDGSYNIVLPDNGTYKVNYQLITYETVNEQKVEAKGNNTIELDIKLRRL